MTRTVDEMLEVRRAQRRFDNGVAYFWIGLGVIGLISTFALGWDHAWQFISIFIIILGAWIWDKTNNK